MLLCRNEFCFRHGYLFFFSSRRRHTRFTSDWIQTCALPIFERAAPCDIVLLPLHGAMVAEGYDDCETDILQRVRAADDDDTIVGVLLDLHCDVTDELIDLADLVVLYKEFPHTDIAARARDLFELAAAAALGESEPTSSLFDCRMIGSYPTSYGPLRAFVDGKSTRLNSTHR